MSKYKPAIPNNSFKKIPEEKIRAWVARYFPDFRERRGGEELLICNPFSSDTNYKMNINPEKQGVHCWTGDEWAGPVNPATGKRNCSFVNFVKIYKKCSFQEAIRDIIGSDVNIKSYLKPGNRTSQIDAEIVTVTLPRGTERIANNLEDEQAQIVVKWLRKRGYSLEDIDKYDICHLGVDCYWPYYEFDALVYWQSRNRFNKIYRFPDAIIYDRFGKVSGKTESTKGDFLYGFDDCDDNYLIITESIFGKHTIGEQCLASGGASLTSQQINKIKILNPRKGLILSPDNDKAGITSIIANHNLLSGMGYKLYYTIPPSLAFQKNGETKLAKDYNELVEYVGMTGAEVRTLHDSLIKPINPKELSRLHSRLRAFSS